MDVFSIHWIMRPVRKSEFAYLMCFMRSSLWRFLSVHLLNRFVQSFWIFPQSKINLYFCCLHAGSVPLSFGWSLGIRSACSTHHRERLSQRYVNASKVFDSANFWDFRTRSRPSIFGFESWSVGWVGLPARLFFYTSFGILSDNNQKTLFLRRVPHHPFMGEPP